jgi:DNA-binding MarR family transcriptional regulator
MLACRQATGARLHDVSETLQDIGLTGERASNELAGHEQVPVAAAGGEVTHGRATLPGRAAGELAETAWGQQPPAGRSARLGGVRPQVAGDGELSLQDAARLRSAVSRVGKGLRATAAGAGLSPSALEALGTVVRRGPIRLSELAALEALNPTMLSRIAAKLEDNGLVRRLHNAEDHRSFSLEATDAGRDLHEGVLAERAEVLVRTVATLAPAQRLALLAALPALEALAATLRGAAR